MINFIYRFIGNQVDAKDLAQEVFLRIYKTKNRYESQSRFSPWLYKIAADLCIDYQRKRKIKDVFLNDPINTEEEEIVREIPDLSQMMPDISIEKKQISKTISSVILSLSESQKFALILKIYENKSYQEISKILNCSVSAVESLIFRARQNLKKRPSFLI